MNVDEILANLSPGLRKKLLSATNVTIDKQPTPSVGLNAELRGGIAYGRQILLWGNKSSGKSSFCLQMIGEAQKQGRSCAWLDAESAFDPAWAQRLGVNTNELIYSSTKRINDMVDVSQQLMQAGTDIIVVDSISALLSAIFFDDKKDELKDLEDTRQIGSDARDMTHAVKMLGYANEKTLLILISQHRNKIGRMFTSLAPTGGEATKFFSSTVIRLWSSESDNQAIKDKVVIGDKAIEKKIGRKVTWTVDFNKTGPAFGSGEYDFYFDGDNVGVDTVGELLDTAVAYGKIEKAGAWLKYGDQQWQGRAAAIKVLRDNEELRLNLLREIDV